MELTEKEIKIAKAYNRKLFPIYKMFSWDLLFYYSIIFIFFVQTKGFTASEIMFADAFYPVAKFIFQVPCVNIVDKFGKRIGIILGNILVCSSILFVIFCPNLKILILINILMSVGYNFKDLCDTNLLNECIEEGSSKNHIFSKIDGKGASSFYYFDAISTCFTGFLFVINPYLPIYICFIICIVATLVSFNFKIFETEKFKNETSKNVEYIKSLKFSYKSILNSPRLRTLITFSGFFYGILSLSTTLMSSLLTELKIPNQYYGIIFSCLIICSALSSNKQNYFHKKFKNRLLTYFSLTYSFSLIAIGLISYANFNIKFTIMFVFIMLSIQYIIKGPYWTLIKRYLNSFTNPEITTKIYSLDTLAGSSIRTLISLFCSWLLGVTSTFVTYAILGCVLSVIFIFLLDYMKTRVGLKPEEYSDIDINFANKQ